MYGVLQTSDVWMWSNGRVRLQTSIKNLKIFKARFKACDFALMQSAIAGKHTFELEPINPVHSVSRR